MRLKESEAQLVQSEKMSSLGQMVAGVAHEINTPLAYVKNSVATVRDRLPELKDAVAQSERLLALLQSRLAGPGRPPGRLRRGERAPRAASRAPGAGRPRRRSRRTACTASSRSRELVVNLKNFSRLDRSKVASFNVNEGVIATLLIAKPQLRNVAVEKRFGEIPSITCSPSQVNQVLLNLVTNAAQALDKPREGDRRHHPARGRRRHRDRGRGQRQGDRARGPAQDLRSLLHHEGGRQGHRAGPFHRLQDRLRARRAGST